MTDEFYRWFARFAAPTSLVIWGVSLVLCVSATLQGSDAITPHLGRWGIWTAMIALAMTTVYVGSQVVARLTQVLALFHDDVPLVEPKHAADITAV